MHEYNHYTSRPQGKEVQHQLKGACVLQAAEAHEDTTLNVKHELVPDELHAAMGGLLCSSYFAV